VSQSPLPPSAYLDLEEDEENSLYLQNKSQAASRYSRSFDRKDYRRDGMLTLKREGFSSSFRVPQIYECFVF
jgi:hypothetical protein